MFTALTLFRLFMDYQKQVKVCIKILKKLSWDYSPLKVDITPNDIEVKSKS